MSRGSARKALLAAVLLLVVAPASASAYTVTIHVHGAGTVSEVTNRLGGSRNQTGCTIGPTAKTNSTTTDCVMGSASGQWSFGDVVRLGESVDPTASTRGWHFDHWTDSSASGFVNCDPQESTGDFTSPDYCEFQIWQDLQVDLWFKDTTGPSDTAISGGPTQGSTTSSTTAHFTSFSAASDPDATFQCRLDPPGSTGSFSVCPANGATFNNLLQNGTWQLTVRAVDPSGNVDTTPAVRSWVVDTTPPVVGLTGGPAAGSTTRTRTADFGVSTSDGSLVCTIDGATLATCTPPTVHVPALNDGQHTFSVRGVDAIGNSSTPTTRTWTVDATPPTVTITGGPTGTTTAKSATFTVTTNEGTPTCTLDGVSTPCAGAHDGLADGPHTFAATATDAVGNTSAPVSRNWTVSTAAVSTADQDHDGFDSPADCNDANAAIHPGATDVPDDGIDQDCNGVDAHNADQNNDVTHTTVPRVPVSMHYKFFTQGATTTIRVLELKSLSAPKTSVTVTCQGNGCRFKSRTGKPGRSHTLDVRKLVKNAPLKAGQTLTIKVSAPGYRARAAKFTMRKGKQPKGGTFAPA